MKVSSKVAEGMVRIDFDANRIQNGKLENVYKYEPSLESVGRKSSSGQRNRQPTTSKHDH